MEEKTLEIEAEKNKNKGCKKGCRNGCLSIFVIFLFLGILGSLLPESETTPTDAVKPVDRAIIHKDTFQGTWAFNVDEVKLHNIDINGYLNGTKVTIEGNTYALTRNFQDGTPFLPNKYWKDAPTKEVNGMKYCVGAMLSKTVCKEPLTDTIKYADTLPFLYTVHQ